MPVRYMHACWHSLIGALICAVTRRLLHIPVSRFVGDYFAMDREEEAEHAMQIFARLVRCLLGQSALAKRKLVTSMPLVILGIQVLITSAGVRMTPDKSKIQRWCVI